MTPTPSQLATLRAVLDRLIPADELPGALAAGTENYVVRQISHESTAHGVNAFAGLAQLDVEAETRHGRGAIFSTLTMAQQDALLADLERGRTTSTWPAGLSPTGFFNRLVDLAHEGFYADPSNGGNRHGTAWRMFGYATGLPRSLPSGEATPHPER